jgi:hypothetical protein
MVKMSAVDIRTIFIVLISLVITMLLTVNIISENRLNSVEILVASQDIPSGIFIKPEMVTKTKSSSRLTNSNEVKDLEELSGLTTITFIPKGMPIVYTQFSPTEKAQAPIQSHNPKNYNLTVDEDTGIGKLYAPGTIDSYLGKFNGIKSGKPIAQFSSVILIYTKATPVRPFGYAENKIHFYTLTPTPAEYLLPLSGGSIQLVLNGANGDEVAAVSRLK